MNILWLCLAALFSVFHVDGSSNHAEIVKSSVVNQRCDNIHVYSVGKPLLNDIVGVYKPIPNQIYEDHLTYECETCSNGKKLLWWTLFGGSTARWCIGDEIGNDGRVVAFKDSDAHHPSEITRRWRPWTVYTNDNNWKMDESIEIKCENKIESSFEYKGDYCWNVGITNGEKTFSSYDYILQKNEWYNDHAVYYSFDKKLYLFYKENHWVIDDKTGYNSDKKFDQSKAFVESSAMWANQISKDSKWYKNGGKNEIPFMYSHCDNPGPNYYYSKIFKYFENEINSSLQANIQVKVDGNVENNENDKETFWQNIISLHKGLENNLIFKQLIETATIAENNDNDNKPWALHICGDDNIPKQFCWNNLTNVEIPTISIGTAALANDEEVILWAVNDFNYEMIDSASDNAPWYQNEYIIGNLYQTNQVFANKKPKITTKLYSPYHGLTRSIECIEDSLNALKMDSIYSYLIHHPQCDDASKCDGTWKTSFRVMEQYWLNGILSPMIGISNFELKEFNELCDWTQFAPINVIQNWFDPIRQQDWNLITSAKQFGIIFQAYSLLGTQHSMRHENGGNPILNSEKLKTIAAKYDKSVAQIVLRWALQHGIGVIPRSSNRQRIGMNIDVFDFQLTQDEMLQIDNF